MHTSKLSDVARIDRASLSSEKIQAGTLYLGLENIESGGNIVKVQVVENGELKSSKFRFTPEHILYGKLRPYLAKITAPDFHGICSTDIIPILPGPKVDRRYLLHLLRQDSMVKFATSRSSGANLPRLSPKELANFQIPLPPLAEQKRIAAILDATDALRAKRRETLAQLDAFLQSTFIEMFGDPVTNPMGWETWLLREVANLENGDRSSKYPSGDELIDRGILFLSTKNIIGSRLFLDDCKFISQEKFDTLSRGKLQRKDVVITLRGTLGSCAVFDCEYETGFINAQILIVRPRKIDNVYLHHLLSSKQMHDHFKRIATGVAVKQLTGKQIGELTIQLPPFDLQHRFAAIVESVEQQKAKMRAHLAELDALFASLQHRAFNGEL